MIKRGVIILFVFLVVVSSSAVFGEFEYTVTNHPQGDFQLWNEDDDHGQGYDSFADNSHLSFGCDGGCHSGDWDISYYLVYSRGINAPYVLREDDDFRLALFSTRMDDTEVPDGFVSSTNDFNIDSYDQGCHYFDFQGFYDNGHCSNGINEFFQTNPDAILSRQAILDDGDDAHANNHEYSFPFFNQKAGWYFIMWACANDGDEDEDDAYKCRLELDETIARNLYWFAGTNPSNLNLVPILDAMEEYIDDNNLGINDEEITRSGSAEITPGLIHQFDAYDLLDYRQDYGFVCDNMVYNEDTYDWYEEDDADVNVPQCCDETSLNQVQGGLTCSLNGHTYSWSSNEALCSDASWSFFESLVTQPMTTPDGSDGCCGDDSVLDTTVDMVNDVIQNSDFIVPNGNEPTGWDLRTECGNPQYFSSEHKIRVYPLYSYNGNSVAQDMLLSDQNNPGTPEVTPGEYVSLEAVISENTLQTDYEKVIIRIYWYSWWGQWEPDGTNFYDEFVITTGDSGIIRHDDIVVPPGAQRARIVVYVGQGGVAPGSPLRNDYIDIDRISLFGTESVPVTVQGQDYAFVGPQQNYLCYQCAASNCNHLFPAITQDNWAWLSANQNSFKIITLNIDHDLDGYTSEVDCDDTYLDVHPGQTQFFSGNLNGGDYNCNGQIEKRYQGDATVRLSACSVATDFQECDDAFIHEDNLICGRTFTVTNTCTWHSEQCIDSSVSAQITVQCR